MQIRIECADNRDFLRSLEDNSVDSIVTDPPYGIAFMNKKWDYDLPSVEIWKECLRVLKPGGHMLVACGTRTQHRMVVNVEDAGFEVRDVITWLYAQGFPKAHDISKAIDKEFSANTPEAKQWEGWKSALKPACEFWTLCRKPLGESTIAKNVLKHGTGGLNIDACRVSTNGEIVWKVPDCAPTNHGIMIFENKPGIGSDSMFKNKGNREGTPLGRFPANLILDEEAAEMLDEQSGFLPGPGNKEGYFYDGGGQNTFTKNFGKGSFIKRDNGGGASRFFYCCKASPKDRGEGNNHATCKPTKLMEYLCKLITPPGGIILDPFMGSGSTGVAAIKNGFGFYGCDREESYVEIASKRINLKSCLSSFRNIEPEFPGQ